MERLIYNRFTFVEAAYAAQSSLSWQTTVVGDPLYRPFAERPDVLHRRLERANNRAVEWSHLRVVNLNMAGNFGPPEEMIKYLRDIPTTKESAVLTEKLGDIYRQQKRLAIAAETYDTAVNLKPSPQQKIRLLLAIGELQTLLAREDVAYDAYRQIISDAPDYPNLAQIYQRLIPLAQRLKRTNEIEQFEAEIQRLTGK
jgi:tetratricopeptide (TPR) repeat protein